MKSQPLHDCSDTLHTAEMKVDNVIEYLDQGKIITAHDTLLDIKRQIGGVRFTIREKALRDEGQKEV